ncbi:bone morphogenetic protein 1-like [Lytechinus variegatus]|uniref:bone morphogenetic protein 1-like n=1 Tax=Lytechinus variegatus TaxID=7654 RepID=UPI001BB1F91D|nr:bone morphogenetic protein 1-like [Lytechinus variegatus]
MISVRGIIFCIHCCLGLILSTELCGAEPPYVWLTGDEQYNISSVDIDQIIEENFILIFNTTIRHRIRFSILDFDFEFGYMFMSIGDGTEIDGADVLFEESSTYTELASFSGSDSPSVVTSVSNSAWMKLTNIKTYQRKMDFNVTVSCTNISDITEVNEVETTLIRSMNYPSNYPNNYYRLWVIRTHEGYVIEVTVRSFDVENGNDHVYIGDGVDSFTNQGSRWRDWTGLWENEVLESRDFTSSTNSVTMIFTTDHSSRKSGFWIQLRAAKKPG